MTLRKSITIKYVEEFDVIFDWSILLYLRKSNYNACPLSEGREQAGKLDNSYGHDQLYDAHFKTGEYIDYPRGRVVWD